MEGSTRAVVALIENVSDTSGREKVLCTGKDVSFVPFYVNLQYV
jgi:hypothetical protein